jgi:glycosyltransferase involved in cell wall biosynthesis
MIVGIDASRAFLKERTGIEEYSYQVIKHLMNKLKGHQVILYSRNMKHETCNMFADNLPENWKVKVIKLPYLWTQLGLSLELLLNPVDVLFIPAHTVPFIHPKNTIVTIHGLEYEFCPDAYSWWARIYMRWSIRNSCRWAKKIIAVSNNTKQDLIRLYKVPEEKITVVYEGVSPFVKGGLKGDFYENEINKNPSLTLPFSKGEKYLLFIGRLEERKNIVGIIKSFEVLKEQYKIPHKLVLAGKFGYGEERIREEIRNVNCANDIILTGYVSEEEKWELLKKAEVFLFPTFYEGFGLPILEAQSVGCPVIAGNNSSILELVNLEAGLLSAVLVNPHNAEEIADTTYKLISDENLRNDIIKRGYENVKRFNWEKCASAVANVMLINE